MLILCLFGLPISWLYIEATRWGFVAFDGVLWPGRLLGFDRFDSAKISFFLSIPALFAASLLGIYNIYKEGSPELNFLAIVAVIFSFIFSYITIALFFKFIEKFSLNLFVIYRVVLSLFILAVVYL